MTKLPLLIALSGVIGLTACVDPNNYANDPTARQRNGTIIGALSGAAVGASSSDDKLEKAAIGAIIGGVAGNAIGYSLDRQAQELRAQMTPGISVTNYGDYLVVNMPQDLLFAHDSANLSPNLYQDLAEVSQSLMKYPQSRIEVLGHTDSTGTASYNMDLSQRRAGAVATVLRNNGVPAGRIAAIGRGMDYPIASNASDQGRAQNRRVEIIIRPY